jgi:hypothetical protein
MNKSTARYYAGFLDGEGCFTMHRNSPRVYASNTHLPSLNRLRDQFGGTVRDRGVGDGERRQMFEWYVYGDSAINVCKQLLPHLREKQAQAALLINARFEPRPHAKESLTRRLHDLKKL